MIVALVSCPECGQEVPTLAEKCQNCGYPIKTLMTDTPTTICRSCGSQVSNKSDDVFCTICGFPKAQASVVNVVNSAKQPSAQIPITQNAGLKSTKPRFPVVMAILFFIFSAVFYNFGIHKMCVYVNSDSRYRDSVNAYVGGDAYNYIINGTYSTSFFVLGVGFMMAGILMIILYHIIKNRKV